MVRRRLAMPAVIALFGAACHGAPRPHPEPVPDPSAEHAAASDSGMPVASADSITGADTSNVAPPEVTGEALRIFGDTMGIPGPNAMPDDEEPSWDIDVRSFETHDRVEYFIDRFTHGSRERFAQELARSGRYEPLIRRKLHAAGLPEDMAYLALIESGYDPHAYSRAAAVGLWQMMTATARGSGLRVDWWVDERRDPVRSTDGAIRFLSSLKEQFGSYYLAAAAYDGGPGRIARGLRRYADELEGTSGDSAFFALAEKDYLRAETRDYVPKLIAAALVAKDPSRYGLSVKYLPEFVYDSVRVGPSTPLAAVGQAVDATVAEMQDLNPGVLRGVTPPGDSFTVRVPLGRAEGFDSAYAALPSDVRTAYTRTTVKKGQTLGSIARRSGITAHELAWYNHDLHAGRSGRLPVGRTVLIPTQAVVSAAFDVPDPAIERYGRSRGRSVTHVVARGETLSGIARRYGTTVRAIQQLNGLKKSIIFPGQVIIVRASSRHYRGVTQHAKAHD